MSVKRNYDTRFIAHPGAIVKEELDTLGLSANALALALGVPGNRIAAIINQSRAMTPDTAIRLAEYFGGAPSFWLNLQSAYDLAKYETEKGKEVRAQVRKPAAA